MIKVVALDNSPLIRKFMHELFLRTREIHMVGCFATAKETMKFLEDNEADVLILDINMPRGEGLAAIKYAMTHFPIPMVVFSDLNRSDNDALDKKQVSKLGAMTFVHKDIENISAASSMWDHLVSGVKGVATRAARVTEKKNKGNVISISPAKNRIGAGSAQSVEQKKEDNRKSPKIVVIGASTGGTQALEVLLSSITNCSLPIVIVQHMPPNFTKAFANRLDSICRLPVSEAVDKEPLKPGTVVIAPGDRHCRIARDGAQLLTSVEPGEPVSHHCPSVDVLFESVANIFGGCALAVLLTGMGNDGAMGLKNLHDKGAVTIVQDEKTSVVFGMPAAAIRLGAAEKILPLEQISTAMYRYL